MRTTIVGALIFLASVASITTSHAQNACFERASVTKHLLDKFKEVPVSVGVGANGVAMELLVSPEGSTWTLLVTNMEGHSCVMASGENWVRIPFPKGPSS